MVNVRMLQICVGDTVVTAQSGTKHAELKYGRIRGQLSWQDFTDICLAGLCKHGYVFM